MKSSTIIFVLFFASCSAAQAQTALEKPFVLASRFGEHVNAYTSLKDKAGERVAQENQFTQEWVGLEGLMQTAFITEERLKVTGELHNLDAVTKDPAARKSVLATITTILGHYATLTDAEIRASGLHAKMTNCMEQNDKMLTDLLAAKKLFELLPVKLKE
jgi:hypothetical protein